MCLIDISHGDRGGRRRRAVDDAAGRLGDGAQLPPRDPGRCRCHAGRRRAAGSGDGAALQRQAALPLAIPHRTERDVARALEAVGPAARRALRGRLLGAAAGARLHCGAGRAGSGRAGCDLAGGELATSSRLGVSGRPRATQVAVLPRRAARSRHDHRHVHAPAVARHPVVDHAAQVGAGARLRGSALHAIARRRALCRAVRRSGAAMGVIPCAVAGARPAPLAVAAEGHGLLLERLRDGLVRARSAVADGGHHAVRRLLREHSRKPHLAALLRRLRQPAHRLRGPGRHRAPEPRAAEPPGKRRRQRTGQPSPKRGADEGGAARVSRHGEHRALAVVGV
mmetsp:Transcript_28511/g.72147  ORF Transcript_28511/g.72147 Transcript_28511/m.72147 type:complete len:339 (-) Transcript_28511:799-1815(-)